MKIYTAPMEGITGYTYRNVYGRHFAAADKYFTPFISAHKKFGSKVKDELEPANNAGINLVPQIMVGSVDEAVCLWNLIKEYGYDELNINAGCPSGTVVHKFRGSGLLRDTYELDCMLEKIFDACSCKLSIKTRLGWDNVDEWEEIARIYGQYPFSEVIIHARVREEFYSGSAHKEALCIAKEYISAPKCYNGDVFCAEDVIELEKEYPWLDSVMVGRGIIADPMLIEKIRNALNGGKYESGDSNKRIEAYMDDMFETYLSRFGSEINTLYHMKELWGFMAPNYSDKAKQIKAIRKTKNISEYKAAVRNILS